MKCLASSATSRIDCPLWPYELVNAPLEVPKTPALYYDYSVAWRRMPSHGCQLTLNARFVKSSAERSAQSVAERLLFQPITPGKPCLTSTAKGAA